MCGIVAYAGNTPCRDFLIEGIKKLEYRGYDSWGFVTFIDGHIDEYGYFLGAPSNGIPKNVNVIPTKNWFSLNRNPKGNIGLCHTRWATHGKVDIKNVHPIWDSKLGEIPTTCVVHNGIVENYKEQKQFFQENNFGFSSETDSEVIANAIAFYAERHRCITLPEIISKVIKTIKGTFAFVAYHKYYPNTIVGYSRGSPLMVTDDGHVASDPIAFVGYADKYAVVPQDCIFTVFTSVEPDCKPIIYFYYPTNNGCRQTDVYFEHDVPKLAETQTSGIPLMLQEIRQQAIPNQEPYNLQIPMKCVFTNGFFLDGVTSKSNDFIFGDNICLFGCGSSYNAALVGRDYLESRGIPTRVEYATELPLRKNDFKNTWFIALTQSGETKDTLEAITFLKEHGADVSVITNNAHSQAARLATPILLRVGPEQAVAATKTFTEQCMKLLEISIIATTKRHQETTIESISEPIGWLLEREKEVERLAQHANDWQNFLFLARGSLYPIALEGALKVKEVAYKHAEAVHASEMKHGPIALIDDNTLSLFLLTCNDDQKLERVCSNIEEIKARGGKIIGIVDDDSQERVRSLIDGPVVTVPTLRDFRSPLVVNVALQLFAYHLAMINGLNVDRPRSLCKSVTV